MKFISIFFTVSFILFLSTSCLSQKHITYVEFGGSGIIFTANYEYRFTETGNSWGAKFGIGGWPGKDKILTIPFQMN